VNDSDSIDDEEVLYRKVSVNSGWYNPEKQELAPDAFRPRRDDTEGISFDRAESPSHPEFRSVQQAAISRSPKGYFVAILKVGGLRHQGFTVIANSLDENPGHALLTDLTYAKPIAHDSQEKMNQLAHQLVVRVEGPFKTEIGEKE